MPARRRSFVAVVKAAESALRAARVKHVFVGALAVSAYGMPRTTSDVDVIVDYRDEDLRRMVEAFRRGGFRVSEEDLHDARVEGSHCTVHDVGSGFHLDLAPAAKSAAEDSLRHALRVRWHGTAIPVADPEHTVVMKLVYGSDQDLEDALGILVRQRGRLQVRRMRSFARQQGVLRALRALENRAGSGETLRVKTIEEISEARRQIKGSRTTALDRLESEG